MLFTWASAARAPRYVYDLNSALVARSKLKRAAAILAATKASSVDIFAHSMGTFLETEGFVEAAQTGRLDPNGRIATVILASPDIDIDLFRAQLAQLPDRFRRKVFLLVSADDGALRVSRLIAGGRSPRRRRRCVRAREARRHRNRPLRDDDSSAGSHAKFAGSPEVVQLIGEGLKTAGRFGDIDSPGLGALLAEVPIRLIGP